MIASVDLPNFGIAKRGNITHIMFWSNVDWSVCSAAASLRAIWFCEFRHFFQETIVIIMIWLCCFAQARPKLPQRYRNEPSDHALPLPNWARDRLGWQCQISSYLGLTIFSNLNVIKKFSNNKKSRFPEGRGFVLMGEKLDSWSKARAATPLNHASGTGPGWPFCPTSKSWFFIFGEFFNYI